MGDDVLTKVEVTIIGAGIIGLAIARKLIEQGKEVLIIEANHEVAQEGTFRNSAVIHAGIYYPSKSMKARFCHQGKILLYDYCKKNKISHQQIGKLIIATNKDQLSVLNELVKNAKVNQVNEIEFLDKSDIQAMEPNVKCVGGLYSPTTGIVNGKELSLALKADIEKQGGEFWFQTTFNSASKIADDFYIKTIVGKEIKVIQSKYLVNAAGLGAINVAENIQQLPKQFVPKKYFAKGNYFKYLKPKPFSRLIYPVPECAGLGIHATIDMANQLRFGPDVEWIDEIDYHVNLTRRNTFLSAIAQYFPSIKAEDLQPEFAGIRPKILPAEGQPQDFLLQDEKIHGIEGLINLFGIESPGLTSSLAIAEYVSAEMFL